MLYLRDEQMKERARLSRGKGLYRKGPLARMRALFFCVIVSTFGLLAIAFAVSCSHTAGNSEMVHTAFKSDASAEETAEPATG